MADDKISLGRVGLALIDCEKRRDIAATAYLNLSRIVAYSD